MGRKKLTPTEQRDAHQGFLHPPPGRRDSRWGFRGMTVRNWLELLVIPVVLVGIGLLFEMQQQSREERRAEAERELAEQRAQDEALQAYLDQMGNLLLEKKLRKSDEGSEVRTIARARTLTMLGRLDPKRKTALMLFLSEAELVQRVDERGPIVALMGADLRGADLRRIDLNGAVLGEADLSDASLNDADLRGADLRGATLTGVVLRYAYLSGADLSIAGLNGTDLSYADLSGATLTSASLNGANLTSASLGGALLDATDLNGADLSDADLREASLNDADLKGATLDGANLGGADLDSANLTGARGVTNGELEQAESLEGAIMPSGQFYGGLLKSRGEDGENE